MAYSHCTGQGLGQVQVTGGDLMGPNILHRNVHAGLKQGQEPDVFSPMSQSHSLARPRAV